MIEALAREYREAASQQRPQAAERAFGKFMKAQTALARCVKQLEDGRTQRDEVRRAVPKMVDRCTSEAVVYLATLMRENAKKLREDIVEVSHERLSLDDFWKRLVRYENEWPMEVGKRVRAAAEEALRYEEARVQA